MPLEGTILSSAEELGGTFREGGLRMGARAAGTDPLSSLRRPAKSQIDWLAVARPGCSLDSDFAPLTGPDCAAGSGFGESANSQDVVVGVTWLRNPLAWLMLAVSGSVYGVLAYAIIQLWH